ncbi:MAG: helicase RepA family protein [Henriciella sp.]
MADCMTPPPHVTDMPLGVYDEGARIGAEVSPNIVTERGEELRAKFKAIHAVQPDLNKPYLIKRWLTSGTMSVIYGPSHVGKTFMALDMAAHIACGVDWNGYRVKAGRVLYIACEGEAGISERLAALRSKFPTLNESPFVLLPTKIDLFKGIDCHALAYAASEFDPDLIIVDTMSRAMGDGDENKSQDMNRFVHSCEVVRDGTAAHLMIIHHSGKDVAKGMRGSSALKAAIDIELEINDDRELMMHKQRDGKKQPFVAFDLKDVHLGVDDDGDDANSAVVVNQTAPIAPIKPKLTIDKLTGHAQAAWWSLDEALNKHGKTVTGKRDIPDNVPHVPFDDWRAEFYQRAFAPDVPSNTKKKTFQRAVSKLSESKLISIFNDVVWTRTDAK